MKKDIIIIGGGVVGLAAAASLASLSLDVAVFDAKPIVKDNNPELDLRVYAINGASQALFESLKAWPHPAGADVLSAYRNMHVWDANSDGILSFDAQELGLPQLGHIVEERRLKNSLLSSIDDLSKVSLHGDCQIESVDINDESVFLQTSLGNVSAKLIIGADGANSWLRQALAFNCEATPYPHHAIVCHVTTENEHNKTAYQIFHHEGPLAFLPLLEKNQCSIVWSMPPEEAKLLMAKSDEAFKRSLTHAFQQKLGKVLTVSKRVSFPLIERKVTPFVKPRVALMGDALHTIHPLAGLGVNLGLSDVAALKKSMVESASDFDAFRTLRHYERSRKAEVNALTTLMSLLSTMFSASGIPSWIRCKVMNLISQSIFLKSRIIRFAAGD
mgnify:CR=1 FL=1